MAAPFFSAPQDSAFNGPLKQTSAHPYTQLDMRDVKRVKERFG